MKTSVSFYTFGQDVDIREACEQSKAAGYDGVELCVSENGQLNMKTTDKELQQLRAMIGDMGLEVSSIGAWNLWEHNLAGYDEADAAYASDIIKKQIECAQALGADATLVVPGWVGTNFAPGIVRYDHAYENAQKRLAALAPVAEAAHVALGVENVWNKFLLSPLEMRAFIDEIGSEWIGSYFDVGNVVYAGYPEQWIRILGKRIKKVHFKDFRRNPGGLNSFVDILAGDVDWPAVMQAFEDIGYDGWATGEMIPAYGHASDQIIYNTAASMGRILEKKF